MSRFTAPITVIPLSDGKSWVIASDDFEYDVGYEGSGDLVSVTQWFITDFASVPQPFWWIPGLTPWGKHGHAAVLHDFGYYLQDRDKPEYDRIFLEAMAVLKTNLLARWVMYLAVRWFGQRAWRSNARQMAKKGPGWRIAEPPEYMAPPALADAADAAAGHRAEAPSVHEYTRGLGRGR